MNELLECAICLSEIEVDKQNECVSFWPCGHFFHQSCTDHYRVGTLKKECPYCKGRISDWNQIQNLKIKFLVGAILDQVGEQKEVRQQINYFLTGDQSKKISDHVREVVAKQNQIHKTDLENVANLITQKNTQLEKLIKKSLVNQNREKSILEEKRITLKKIKLYQDRQEKLFKDQHKKVLEDQCREELAEERAKNKGYANQQLKLALNKLQFEQDNVRKEAMTKVTQITKDKEFWNSYYRNRYKKELESEKISHKIKMKELLEEYGKLKKQLIQSYMQPNKPL